MEWCYWAAMQRVHGLTMDAVQLLLSHFESAENIWQSSLAQLRAAKLSASLAKALHAYIHKDVDAPKKLQEQTLALGIHTVNFLERNYPPLLKEIYDPPLVLFYRGHMEPEVERIAMVGSRKFSRYGESAAKEIAEVLARSGITVVSGAARGIDTASHKGALAGGRTVAVLGCGVDRAYPSENKKLLEEIAEVGAVISEYAPGTPPLPQFFPARNRIISGLSMGTVVVEAAKKSGSLITARMAVDENRDVFALPGSIYSAGSEGCHHLIQQGARLVTSAEDILEVYGRKTMVQVEKKKLPNLSEEELAVYRTLSYEHPLTLEEVLMTLGEAEPARVMFLLLQMELKGIIIENEAQAYMRANRE